MTWRHHPFARDPNHLSVRPCSFYSVETWLDLTWSRTRIAVSRKARHPEFMTPSRFPMSVGLFAEDGLVNYELFPDRQIDMVVADNWRQSIKAANEFLWPTNETRKRRLWTAHNTSCVNRKEILIKKLWWDEKIYGATELRSSFFTIRT